ncbi:MAG: protease pro-enzyme activation domain-containing protein, partial [Acidobacteriaceae bacterium]
MITPSDHPYTASSRAAVLVAALLVFAWMPAGAQTFQGLLQRPQNHIRPEVATGQAPLVGALPVNQRLNFSIVLPLRNPAQLNSLLARLYDPASPDYRHFLTVDQFTDQFGPTAQDYQAVVAFALLHGFTVTATPANRLVVPVSGSVAQVESALNVRMNIYQHPTENRTFFSPDRDPSLAINAPIAAITGLTNFSLPHPMVIPPSPDRPQVPNVTGSGPGGSYLASDMRAAYYGGTTLDGTGQAVGLLEFDGYDAIDVADTFTTAGQTYNVSINNVLLDGATGGPTNEDGEAEVVLDIVQAIGMAPGLSQVRVYIGNTDNGVDDANILNSIATENIAKQISCSWGWRPDDPATDDNFFEEMAAQGQSFFAASGDSGAFDFYISPFFYPGEDDYVTAVGGTSLTTASAGGAWNSEVAWNYSGGGVSPDSISIPSWQTGVANSSNGGSVTLRNVPDVAMEADFDNYLCSFGTCEGGWAGTSFAAPRWAGFMAMVNQQAVENGNALTGGLGFLNPPLYAIGAGTDYDNDLHDISSGNNGDENQPVWYSAVAGYDLVTGWGSANGANLINDLAGPQVPGFWIHTSTPGVGIAPGSSGATTISITDAGGFTGNVSLGVGSTLPTGVTASWGTNPTAGSSVLTLTAASDAPTSSTNLTITGTSPESSGELTANTTIALTVHPPTFLLSSNPPVLNIYANTTATSAIIVTPEYGFTGNVSLSIAGLPSGVTASFSPASTSGTSTLTLTGGSSVTAGTSTLTVTGTSGNLTVTTALTLTVQGPSFSLDTPSSVSIGQGASTSTYLYIYPEYGFSGNVSLSVSGLPSGITATFSPNPVATTSGYEASSVLTLTAANSTAIGTSTVTIAATSGSITATTTFSLSVYAPTFYLSTSSALNIGQGSQGTDDVTIEPEYGFNGNVTLSVTGLPPGVTALWSPNPTTGDSQLVLSAASSVPAGNTTLTITGTSGSITATTKLTLGVQAPTFTLDSGGSVNMGEGTSGTSYVYIYPQYGFSGNVSLSLSGLPSGVTATLSPNPIALSSGTYEVSSTLTFTASSSATVGNSTVTIKATSGNITQTTTLALSVNAPTFSIYAGSVNVGQGTSATSYVDINDQYGFTGSVKLSVSGLPAGVTSTFSPNPSAGNSTLTLTASASAPLGTSTATITGTSGSITQTTIITVGIYQATFSLYGGGNVSIGQGMSGTSYIEVNPNYGFAGNVSFSVSGLPSGVTASFSPNPASLAGNGSVTDILTLTASNSAPTGQYNLTVIATSGALTQTTSFTLGVYSSSFTLSTGGAYLGQGSSTTSNVWVYSQYGFAGNVNLSISGVPSGVTATFGQNPVTVASGSDAYTPVTITVANSAVPGNYNLTVSGTSGALTVNTTFPLTIYPPSFTLSSSFYYSTGLNAGSSTTGTVYLYP